MRVSFRREQIRHRQGLRRRGKSRARNSTSCRMARLWRVRLVDAHANDIIILRMAFEYIFVASATPFMLLWKEKRRRFTGSQRFPLIFDTQARERIVEKEVDSASCRVTTSA